jgi:hypothetical protein
MIGSHVIEKDGHSIHSVVETSLDMSKLKKSMAKQKVGRLRVTNTVAQTKV